MPVIIEPFRIKVMEPIALPSREERPLSSIGDSFEEVHARRTSRRLVLVPEL